MTKSENKILKIKERLEQKRQQYRLMLLVILFSFYPTQFKNNSFEKIENKTQKTEQKSLTRSVEYQVDTVQTENERLAYYLSKTNTINQPYTGKHIEKHILTHEQKHKDNYLKGAYTYPMSWEQVYKLSMHDEISANIAALLSLRTDYIKTHDINVFHKNTKRFDFYADAIQKGQINPETLNFLEFHKEMYFIANKMRQEWMKSYSQNKTYLKSNASLAYIRHDKSGKYVPFYDKNYQKAKDIIYTIGGINFNLYMDKDVQIPQSTESKILLKKKTSYRQLCKKLHVPLYDGLITLQQYQKLVQHALLINDLENRVKLEIMATSLLPEKTDSINIRYSDKKISPVSQDKAMKLVQSYKEDMLKKSVDFYLVNTIMKGAAEEYALSKKPFPSNNKKTRKLYQDKIQDIYTIHFKLLDCQKSVKTADFLDIKNSILLLNGLSPEVLHIIEKQNHNNFSFEKTNKPINDIPNGTFYRSYKNEDGFRVSPVQTEEIYNMESNLLKQAYLNFYLTPFKQKQR